MFYFKSHFYVKGDMLNRERPKDWTQPVDYRNGSVHIRLEVIEKPAGGEPTTAVLHYKPSRSRVPETPDHHVVETEGWVVYPFKGGA